MTTQENTQPQQKQVVKSSGGGGADAIYGIGLIGAWVFYFKRATTPQERVIAFFKGIVWPAFVVYDLMVFLEKHDAADDA
jgi:hypothetical protein